MKILVRQLELLVRHGIVYPLLRLVFHNAPVPLPVDIRKLRKVLILRYDRIGDIVVTTPIFRILKKANPNLFLGVLASPSNAELILQNKHVDRVHVLHSNWYSLAKEIVAAHKENYDLVLNFIFNRTTSGGVLANCIAPRGIKVGQGAEKYRFYFNVLLKLDRGSKHMAEVLSDFVKDVFGLSVAGRELAFDIPIDAATDVAVEDFLRARKLLGGRRRTPGKKGYVVFNISATEEVRRISGPQAKSLLTILTRELQCNTVVISSPADEERRARLVRECDHKRCWKYPEAGNAGLREIAALIKRAKAVVTPDTAIVHLASASKTPVLGFFTPLTAAAEWSPHNVKHKIVLAENDKPVSSIPVDQLRSELKSFLKNGI